MQLECSMSWRIDAKTYLGDQRIWTARGVHGYEGGDEYSVARSLKRLRPEQLPLRDR